MILSVVGASARAIEIVRAVGLPLGVEVRTEVGSPSPDWVLTATADERTDSLRRWSLPGYRVIHVPQLGDSTGPQEAILRNAVSRMVEAGPLVAPQRQRARLAPQAIPLLTEWASWLAADEGRATIATHREFLRGKHGDDLRARVMLVVPGVQAFNSLGGLLSRLADERHRVHVVVVSPPDSDPDLAAWQDRQWGLTVSGLAELQLSPWRPLVRLLRSSLDPAVPLAAPLRAVAVGLLGPLERALPLEISLISAIDEFKPDVAMVVPHRSAESIETDVIRVARWLAVPSVLVPLQWDDLERSCGLAFEQPDAIALWNEHQRAHLARLRLVPSTRVDVTGALLPTDVIGSAEPASRDDYCAKLELDPAQRIIFYEAPVVSSRTSVGRFQEWRQRVKGSPDPKVSAANVVVYVDSPDEVAIWRRLEASADIAVARAGLDERRSPFRLNDSLNCADVVLTVSLGTTLESLARGRPTIAWIGDEGQADLGGFCREYPPERGGPLRAENLEAAGTLLSAALTRNAVPESAFSPSVRPSAEGSAVQAVYALLDELTRQRPTSAVPRRPPLWRRFMIVCLAAWARYTEPQAPAAKSSGTPAKTDRNAGAGSA